MNSRAAYFIGAIAALACVVLIGMGLFWQPG